MASLAVPDITEVPTMMNNSTVNKLIEMHMSPMANAFKLQLDDPKMKDVSFEDRF